MSEKLKVKRKRTRVGATHRWTKKETDELIQKVLLAIQQRGAGFEKPTSQVFYQRIAKTTPVLRSIHWRIMKSKMRHVHSSYKAALEWYHKDGLKQLNYYESEQDCINKICPYYHFLKQIFNKADHHSRSETIQQQIDEETDKMATTNESSGQFLVLDTAAVSPDSNAENSEIEGEIDEDLHDNNDVDANNDNVESDSYASYDEEAVEADTSEAQKLKFIEINCEKQLKSLELEKEKLRKARHSFEKQKKQGRSVHAPYHRWTDIQTEDFLTAVYNTVKNNFQSLEKPTSQRFYDRIIANTPRLKPLNWQILKSKLRHSRILYLKAVTWRKQMGAKLTAAGKEQEVMEHIQQICPFWRILVQIFGDNDDKSFTQNFDETTHTSYDDDISSKDLNEIPQFSSIEICKEEAIIAEDEELVTDTNGAVSTSGVVTDDMYNEALWDGEKAKPSGRQYEEKVELNDAKWDKMIELKILHLQVEKEKIQLERERTQNELEIKKLELQYQLDVRKLELLHDEKIKIANQKLEIQKYEMELKFNRR